MSKKRRKIAGFIKYAVVGVIGIIMIVPFFWLVSASLMTLNEFIAVPPKWIPANPQWHNYVDVFQHVPFLRYYFNSFIVAISVTALVLLTSAMGGYAFAKLNFLGKKALFRFTLSTMMFPAFLFLIPNFYLITLFGWTSNYLSLVMPFAVSAYGIFLLRQFIMSIPHDLMDAARIDGASQFTIFTKIIIPLTKPALATLAILTFIGQWNSFLWPLIITSFSPEMTTIPVGLSKLSLAFSTYTNQNLILAGMVLQIIPVVALFLYMQRYYIKGIVLTGFGGI